MHTPPKLPVLVFDDIVRRTLQEDLGCGGDLTSQSVVPAGTQIEAVFVTRQSGIVSGLDVIQHALTLIDSKIDFSTAAPDGSRVIPGQVIAKVHGDAQSLLISERSCLNFLSHLSGIATATHQFVEAIEGTGARICCTRKTTPGLRALEKYAVRTGGGFNHRFNLSDAILIKDNHIAAAGGVTKALQYANAQAGHMTVVEIEIDTLPQLEEALEAGATRILLDNMSIAKLVEAVSLSGGRAILEASGNVKLEQIRKIAETGVDYVSSGWITHSSPCLDIGLDFGSTSSMSS